MREIHVVMTTVSYEQKHLEKLRKIFEPAEFIHVHKDDKEGIAAALQRADIAVLAGDLDERYWNAPALRWIHCDHAGLNKSARPELFERDLIVTSSAGRSAPALAEHALFFMLTLTYNFTGFYAAQQAHQWGIPGQDKLRSITGQTLGIIGIGNTGKELAARAKACDMRVLAYDRMTKELPRGVDVLYSAEAGQTIDPLLQESDFIVLALPLTNETYHLIGARELKLMKSSAFLINMARGAIIHEEALIEALRNGDIAGAGLDTFEQEPLPVESPLWDAPNVLITPHVTPQVPDRTGRSLEIIAENARRYRSEEKMLNLLTAKDIFTK